MWVWFYALAACTRQSGHFVLEIENGVAASCTAGTEAIT